MEQKVDQQTKLINPEDNDSFTVGARISNLTCLLVTKLSLARIIDPNELTRIFDKFKGLSGEGAVLKIDSRWTDEDHLRSLPLRAAESIRDTVQLLNQGLRQARAENWRDPNLV